MCVCVGGHLVQNSCFSHDVCCQGLCRSSTVQKSTSSHTKETFVFLMHLICCAVHGDVNSQHHALQ